LIEIVGPRHYREVITQMSRLMSRRPSAAFVVAVFALCFALVGSAIAGTDSAKKALSKSQVKKISKKQADKEINKKAAGLSVAHATSADTATSATSATQATNADSPSVYAHVTVTGSAPHVDEARSKGFTDADFVDTTFPGEYCATFPNYKTATGIQDEPISTATGLITVHVIPDNAGICAAAGFTGNTLVLTVNGSGTLTRGDFDIQLGL
jgi:hypothetical protein